LSAKFYKLVLGWVGSIDAKGTHFAQPRLSSGCPMEAQFTAKNAFLVFFAVNCFCRTAWRLYGLSKMNALCINWSYSPKDQFLKFWRKLLSFWGWLKNSVFLSRPFWTFYFTKLFFFCLIPI
jgi:hypothetical protein